MKGEEPNRWRRFMIGDFEATIVSDGTIAFDGIAAEFPDQPEAEANRLLDPAAVAGRPGYSPLNCLVLDTDHRLLLFNAGMGASTLLGERAGRLPENLAAAGVRSEAIDAILLTHLHCDHTCGLIDARGVPVFPNAELLLPSAEFDFCMSEPNADSPIPTDEIALARRCVAPYRARLRLISGDAEIFEGVTPVATLGHTIGHTSYLIASAGQRALNIGDICHHGAVQFANPQWRFRWEDDPQLAVLSRQRIFGMAADEDLKLIGYHLPYPGLGRVRREGSGFRFAAAKCESGF